MADGSLKYIQDIRTGDNVATRMSTGNASTSVTVEKVVQTFEHVHVGTIILSFVDGTRIETTVEHPFFLDGRGFVPAGHLAIGNAIVTRAGPAVKLAKIIHHAKSKTVYNFEVAGSHTCFVGRGNAWLWVHNDCFTGDQ